MSCHLISNMHEWKWHVSVCVCVCVYVLWKWHVCVWTSSPFTIKDFTMVFVLFCNAYAREIMMYLCLFALFLL